MFEPNAILYLNFVQLCSQTSFPLLGCKYCITYYFVYLWFATSQARVTLSVLITCLEWDIWFSSLIAYRLNSWHVPLYFYQDITKFICSAIFYRVSFETNPYYTNSPVLLNNLIISIFNHGTSGKEFCWNTLYFTQLFLSLTHVWLYFDLSIPTYDHTKITFPFSLIAVCYICHNNRFFTTFFSPTCVFLSFQFVVKYK